MCNLYVLGHSIVPDSLLPHGLQSASLLYPWRFSQQEYWSRLPCPPPWNLPNPGIEPRSPTLQADSLLIEPPEKSMCNLEDHISQQAFYKSRKQK